MLLFSFFRHLLDCIMATDDFKNALKVEKKLTQEQLFGQVTTGILQGFLDLDEKLRKIPEVANGEDKSGTTAVCALITEQYVIFSNCGDSRGVLSRGKVKYVNDDAVSEVSQR